MRRKRCDSGPGGAIFFPLQRVGGHGAAKPGEDVLQVEAYVDGMGDHDTGEGIDDQTVEHAIRQRLLNLSVIA